MFFGCTDFLTCIIFQIQDFSRVVPLTLHVGSLFGNKPTEHEERLDCIFKKPRVYCVSFAVSGSPRAASPGYAESVLYEDDSESLYTTNPRPNVTAQKGMMPLLLPSLIVNMSRHVKSGTYIF